MNKCLMMSLMTCLQLGCCQDCNSRFIQAADRDYFSSENVLKMFLVSDLSQCTAACYRHRFCLAVSFDQSSSQCHLFKGYRTQSAGDSRVPGVEYFTLESLCGPSGVSLPVKYTRDGFIMGLKVMCNDRKIFKGTNDTMFCLPPSTRWTYIKGDCVEKLTSWTIDAIFLRAVDSRFIIFGVPTGDVFTITIIDEDNYYNLKALVNMSSGFIRRSCRSPDGWQTDDSPLLSSFPFVLNETFTMEIVNTFSAFECTVNGELSFTFDHKFPTDAILEIRIYHDINLLKLLTT